MKKIGQTVTVLFSLLLTVLLFAAVLPEKTALAEENKVNYIEEVLPEDSPEIQNLTRPKFQHDASWYKQDAVYNRMMNMKSSYPEGMTWTNDNYYQHSYFWHYDDDEGRWVSYTGYGCAGFALILSDAAFGDDLDMWKYYDVSFSKVRVGDILRINDNTHSVIVLKKNSDSVTIAEGNYGGQIHWGRTLSAAEVNSSDYMLSRWPGVPSVTYKVTYNANGGTGAPAPQYKAAGEDLWLSLEVPVRSGYFFIGWAESAGAKEPVCFPDYNYSDDADLTLYAVWEKIDMRLPSSLKTIEDEAFAGCAFRFALLSENTESIGARVFANCNNLRYIYIPYSIDEIDYYAFNGTNDITILCHYGTEGCTYADYFGIPYIDVWWYEGN